MSFSGMCIIIKFLCHVHKCFKFLCLGLQSNKSRTHIFKYYINQSILFSNRQLVYKYKPAYDAKGSTTFRQALAKRIVDEICPGRFLKFDGQNTARVLDYEAANTKVSDVFVSHTYHQLCII